MLPTVAIPVLMPIRACISGSPRAFIPRAISLSRFWAPTAERQARSAWSAWSIGSFQNAMMASPMYLSMVPSVRKISSAASLW